MGIGRSLIIDRPGVAAPAGHHVQQAAAVRANGVGRVPEQIAPAGAPDGWRPIGEVVSEVVEGLRGGHGASSAAALRAARGAGISRCA